MQNLDFVEKSNYKKQDVKKVQNRLLEMAKITTNILEKNNYKYIITFGTLLGAVRHNGFIPWDDDFDIFIFEDEYEDVLNCLRENLPSDIIVHDERIDENYVASWSKLRDVNTSRYIINKINDKYSGINLDLYKIKKVLVSEYDVDTYKERINYNKRLYRKKMIGSIKYIKMTLLFKIKLFFANFKVKNNNDYIWSWNYIYRIALKEDEIFPIRKYSFEGLKFYGPNNYDLLLKQAYGEDYMKIPSFEKRIPKCDGIVYKKIEIL